MEIVRTTPGKIYARSNTGTTVKLLTTISAILIVLVVGICVYIGFGQTTTTNFYLDESEMFYYSLNDDQAKLELYAPKGTNIRQNYTIPSEVTHDGKTYQITQIGAKAFANQISLESVKIPATVKVIGGNPETKTGAFSGCVNLMHVTFEPGLTHIECYAFKNCLALKEVTLPQSLLFVGAGAFMNNWALDKIELASNNVQMDDTCWQTCPHVTTLVLADDVVLDISKKRALATLGNLKDVELNENPNYQVVDHCLLSANGESLVLGCRDDGDQIRTLPTTVKHLEEWAFGHRYGNDAIWLPSTILTVGANAFSDDDSIIYTNATTQPDDWKTTLPVRCGAEIVTFNRNVAADDTVTATGFIFQAPTDATFDDYEYDPVVQCFCPTYQSLFANTTSEHLFTNWKKNDDTTYVAVYADETPATTADEAVEGLSNLLQTAGTLKDNETLRLKFTLDYWEEFKTAYGWAKDVNDRVGETARLYEVKNVTTKLQKYVAVLQHPETADNAILESTDWRVGLPKLVAAVETLDKNDFTNYNTENKNVHYLNTFLASSRNDLINENVEDSAARFDWECLRQYYETLTADTSNASPLVKLISECEKLSANAYTAESWANLQTKLAAAKQVTPYNQSVTVVRQALQRAKTLVANGGELVPNNLADLNEVLLLYTWASVGTDLDRAAYTTQSYDLLSIALSNAANVLNLEHNGWPAAATVQSATNLLTSRYYALQRVAVTPTAGEDSKVLLNTIPYFIIAAILFTGAVVAQAAAVALKRTQRNQKNK